MKKTIITLLCIMCLIICVKNCTGKKEIQLTGVEGINYSFDTLPNNVVEYLKNKSNYKNLYKDKKFIIYYVGADCPYAQLFINTIEPLKSNTDISNNYNFYAETASGFKRFESMEDANAHLKFSDKCQEFCIINPAQNKIFSINGIGYEETSKLETIIKQLKNW